MPAFLEAMETEKAEVEAIANHEQAPTFENTIEALEKSGELLDRVGRVFGCLNGVAHVLTGTGQEVEDRGLTAIRIAR